MSGTHAHAAGEERGYAVGGEMLGGGAAAALLVGHVGQGAHGFDRAVLDLHDGVDVAVAEMHTHTGFKAAGKCGRDSESRRADWIDSCWLKFLANAAAAGRNQPRFRGA